MYSNKCSVILTKIITLLMFYVLTYKPVRVIIISNIYICVEEQRIYVIMLFDTNIFSEVQIMDYSKFPPVKDVKLPDPPYFPNKFYTAVFRLWETCSAKRISKALGTSEDVINTAASHMGLPKQQCLDKWAERGYITTIKNAWHVLPYEQIITLLDWDENKLATVLKEDDFLEYKLNYFKPFCEPVKAELVDENVLLPIKNTMEKYFSDFSEGALPFDFCETLECSSTPVSSNGIKMIYSYCGLYATVLDNDIDLSYPDKLLQAYHSQGINAVWLPVVLYQMFEFPFDKSYSVGYEKRRENLKLLVEKAKKYGIKVFLYLNEPRCMPLDFFKKHPELYGKTVATNGSLCTSVPAVMDYLRFAVEDLCRAVPDIGGFFAITQSENLTNCKSVRSDTECERCKDIPLYELMAQVLTAISEASRKVNPEIRLFAWLIGWIMPLEDSQKCIDLIPEEVTVLCISEERKTFNIGGVTGQISDYSMSIPGPGDMAKQIWSYAKSKGHETCAKVQVNDTWECSTMPFLPVFDLIREHMIGIKQENVDHLMLSWTLGGYPSINLKVATSCLDDPSEQAYDELLKNEYGEHWQTVKKAAKQFSDAFREFPFHVRNLYFGPHNAGPANMLYPKKTGFEATMTCFAYDDIDKWRYIYPQDVYINQYKKLSEKWQKGLETIKDMPDCLFKQTALGGYLLFYSSYLQSEFIDKRETADNKYLYEIAKKEKENALLMYSLMNKSSTFGYEAANHYYFNKMILAEKVLNCEHLEKLYNK